MIVATSDFQAEISIGQIEQADVQATVNEFIGKYEPLYLLDLLGKQLYDELKEELSNQTPEQKWNDLSAMVKLPCADFIYYWYMRFDISQSAGVGEIIPQSDNSSRTTNGNKMERAWNEMVTISRKIVHGIDRDIYPEFSSNNCSDIFKYVNSFGI